MILLVKGRVLVINALITVFVSRIVNYVLHCRIEKVFIKKLLFHFITSNFQTNNVLAVFAV
jgi:hypothetical protein